MNPLQRLHGAGYKARRTQRLADHLAALLPEAARVLDVGCGDGAISARIAAQRPDLSLTGLDVFVRERTHIPVSHYDGRQIPHPDRSFDAVLFVDVLHHCPDPVATLREGARVAKRALVLKDHLCESALDAALLRFMDRVGNPSDGVDFPSAFLSRATWERAFGEIGLALEAWRGDLKLFPTPLDWCFGRGLHFVARLRPDGAPTGD